MKLTQAFVKGVTCKEGIKKQEFYDDGLKGFILEVRTNGRKTFFLRFTDSQTKKTSYTKIADATILPLEEAKQKALKLKRSIEEDKEVIIDTPPLNASSMTVLDFYQAYYLPYIQTHSKSWRSTVTVFTNHTLKRQPSTANKFLIYLSHLYRIHTLYFPNATLPNPVKPIRKVKENNEKERYLNKRETKRLLDALSQSLNPHLKHIIPFLILTGARRNEVLHAKWKEIDFVQGMDDSFE